MTESTGRVVGQPAAELEGLVRTRARRLQDSLLDRSSHDHALTVAQLARLRRVGIDRPDDPAVWDIVFAGVPDQLVGRGDAPSRAERALHASLVLLAVHLQSANGPRHVKGQRLGHAIGELARRADAATPAETAVAKRFRAFATATSFSQALSHLRGLVTLLRGEGVGLDYGSLAKDLYWMQTPEGLRRTRLHWGRDFHFLKANTDSTEKES
ncbi:MAG: type I-E CRISPR-associated protein Cse2/CasB [Micrococcales bacterium]|nr:type I-E CRISPR-associated protein Cse2/CasB [Micrococcales bacterium]